MDCSTIIVSYNTFEYTRAAIDSVLSSGITIAHEVIVVDNASPDDSGDRLRAVFDGDARVTVVDSGGNIGFAAANNLGVRHASGGVLFFLNPDAVVHGRGVTRLVEFMRQHHDVGAVGPHIVNTDGTDQASVLTFPTRRELLRYYLPVWDALQGRDRRTDPTPDRTQPVDAVKGCALALRREAFEAVGGWDATYFMYAEEVELCWQLAKRGLTNVFFRDVTVTHHGGVASRDHYVKQQVLDRRSTLQFLRRHGERGTVALNRLAGALGFGARAVAFKTLARLRPDNMSEYDLRGRAASALWRWFVFSYD